MLLNLGFRFLVLPSQSQPLKDRVLGTLALEGGGFCFYEIAKLLGYNVRHADVVNRTLKDLRVGGLLSCTPGVRRRVDYHVTEKGWLAWIGLQSERFAKTERQLFNWAMLTHTRKS